MLRRNRLRAASTSAMVLGALCGAVGATEEQPAESAVVSEEYDVSCTPGDPVTIEVAPATGRVELKFSNNCYCFDSEEAASAWLAERAALAMTGETDLEIDFATGATKVAEPEPGEEVPVVMYCLTTEQVLDYQAQLESADSG